ncbi:MAG: transglutaminase [Betaproteobacteria bacterium HGW-Betaproteobacteria-21]|nr:MAG: transglutaminase [Betaproteobacteria bacterium HGW-Betaproteobacteria-21]
MKSSMVPDKAGMSAAKVWLRLFLVSTVLTLIAAGSLAPHLRNSAELVRMRNALLLQSEPAAYDWTPATMPGSFAVDSGEPLPLYADIVARNALRVEGDDWATAVKIGRHLLVDGMRTGGAIQSDLTQTYRRITELGEGYCGDFADTFTGLASAAGIFTRPWAFSFDGFGGHGHIFNEVWDAQQARWIMIDVFNNFYPVDAAGRPLSAMAFRNALLTGETVPQLVPVDALAKPGFKYVEKAIAYYRSGLPEWYMWWGSNVFENDQAFLVRMLGGTHRALEQLGGIAAGTYPGIRILETSQNQPQRESMHWLRLRLIVATAAGVFSLIFFVAWLATRRGSKEAAPQGRPI